MANKIKPIESGIFTNYIYKSIPLAFDDSMSYYQTLSGLLAYLQNTVIPTVNQNVEQVNELGESFDEVQEGFEDLTHLVDELQEYVDTYFDNLDVQQEINNKLDEMVEDGTFDELLADYLQISVLSFNSVSAMKLADNLVNGSTCKTLGFYQVNDGGGAIYKVRTKTESETADERSTIALSDDSLIAEIVLDSNIINPKQFGAYCDNTHDDSDALQYCLNKANSMSSSNGTRKRTVYIPATMKVTSQINCTTAQFKLLGSSLNNSRISLSGENACIVFGKPNDEVSYEIEIENICFAGTHDNTHSLLTFNRCINLYLTRVQVTEGGENQYDIELNHCGIITMDRCIISGSDNATLYPCYSNGIKINSIGSIFNFTNANCWNLNKLFSFSGNIQNINICNNWIECVKSLVDVDCQQDNRCMNFKVIGNTINIHQHLNISITEFAMFDFDMENNTNFNGSNITLDNNTIYFYGVENIKGNSLVYFNGIGNSASSEFYINFNSNIFNGNTLTELGAYVFTNVNTDFNTGNNVRIVSYTVGRPSTDRNRLTTFKKIIGCGYNGAPARVYNFPNGVYLSESNTFNDGSLYYADGEFYAGYNGTAKVLPKNVGTAIPYATSENYLSVINSLVTALSQAHITKIQQS